MRQNAALCGNGSPFPKWQILDSYKLKELTDHNFDKNIKKFSTGEENTLEKGEIAHYKQFLLFP